GRYRSGLSRLLPRRRPRALRTSLLARGRRRPEWAREARAESRPYVTIALVAVPWAVWVGWRGGFVGLDKLIIVGPLHGDWWRLFTSQFAYGNGVYAFVTVLTIAIFGWLLERRRGPAVVLALFLGAGAAGALVASAVYADAIVSGANAAALCLVAAWAVPDLQAARAGLYYEGDLLGAGALAALLLAIPFAEPEASWLAGVTGAAIGLLFGFGIHRLDPSEL